MQYRIQYHDDTGRFPEGQKWHAVEEKTDEGAIRVAVTQDGFAMWMMRNAAPMRVLVWPQDGRNRYSEYAMNSERGKQIPVDGGKFRSTWKTE